MAMTTNTFTIDTGFDYDDTAEDFIHACFKKYDDDELFKFYDMDDDEYLDFGSSTTSWTKQEALALIPTLIAPTKIMIFHVGVDGNPDTLSPVLIGADVGYTYIGMDFGTGSYWATPLPAACTFSGDSNTGMWQGAGETINMTIKFNYEGLEDAKED